MSDFLKDRIPVLIAAAIFLVCLVIYLFVSKEKSKVYSWKYACSLMFIATAAAGSFACRLDSRYWVLILVGLICSAFGDVFLNIDCRGIYFSLGVLSFTLAHCCYIAGYTEVLDAYGRGFFEPVQLALVGAYVIFGVVIFKLKKYRFTFPGILAYLYGIILTFMTVKALFAGIETGLPGILTLTLGAILFFASDLILLDIIFGHKNDKAHVRANLAAYYIGQLLIALSVAFLPAAPAIG